MTKTETEWDLWLKQFKKLKKCIVAEREGPHKVACRERATHKSPDGCPVCESHQNINARETWKGFIKGA